MKHWIAAILVALIPVSVRAAVPVIANWNEQLGTVASARDSVAKPASIASGELVVLLVIHADNTAGPCLTWPSGFDEFFQYGDATVDTWIAAAWKVAGGSEPSYYVATSSCSTDEWCMWALRITGQNATATKIENGVSSKSSNNTTGADTLIITEATTTLDSCLAIYITSFDGGDGDPMNVTGATSTWTETDEAQSGTSTTSSVTGAWGTKSILAKGGTGACNIKYAPASGSSDGKVGGILTIHGVSSTDPVGSTMIIITH